MQMILLFDGLPAEERHFLSFIQTFRQFHKILTYQR